MNPKMKIMTVWVWLCLLAVLPTGYAQTKPPASTCKDAANDILMKFMRSVPYKEDFSKLLATAQENVSSFETAVMDEKPALDEINTILAKSYLDNAAAAHAAISAAIEKGPTGFRLVGVLATLENVSVNAASASTSLAGGHAMGPEAQRHLVALTMAGASCTHIASIISDVTQRLIAAEEATLTQLAGLQN